MVYASVSSFATSAGCAPELVNGLHHDIGAGAWESFDFSGLVGVADGRDACFSSGRDIGRLVADEDAGGGLDVEYLEGLFDEVGAGLH